MYTEIGTLVFEVTRKCNMNCAHCLRGCSQDMDLREDFVDKVLDHVNGISTIIFTGGEPTLNLPMIRYILEQCKKRKIGIDSFFIATNGKTGQMELATLLLEYAPIFGDLYNSSVAVSRDIYHDDTPVSPLEFLSFYSDCKEMGSYRDGRSVLRRGKAAIDPQFDEATTKDIDLLRYTVEDGILSVEQIYVSCDGNIVADCDLPYTMMETMAEANVWNIGEIFRMFAEA